MTSNFDESTGLLLIAIHFAADKHRDQRRKGEGHAPYINHPIAVAETLWNSGSVRDTATLIAAVLHDTIEDTTATPDELRRLFGEEVLKLVLEVTDDKSLPSDRRKQLQIDHAPHISTKAKLIKLGDKISNLRDLVDTPPPDWPLKRRQEYAIWTERVVSGLRGTNAALEAVYDLELKRSKEKYHIQE
jgi:guanosine-3',5'-bis(diphosphate) 3'-pyrophosphohydrolase